MVFVGCRHLNLLASVHAKHVRWICIWTPTGNRSASLNGWVYESRISKRGRNGVRVGVVGEEGEFEREITSTFVARVVPDPASQTCDFHSVFIFVGIDQGGGPGAEFWMDVECRDHGDGMCEGGDLSL